MTGRASRSRRSVRRLRSSRWERRASKPPKSAAASTRVCRGSGWRRIRGTMLLPGQRRLVIDAVAEELSLKSTLQVFARTSLAPDELAVLKHIPNSVTLPDEQATLLVDLCIAEGWSHLPTSLLERVLDRLVAGGRGNLVAILTQVQTGVDPNPDPTKALWVTAELPFFSRANLRPLVAKLITANAQPILRIVGPATQGEECG